MNIFVLMIILFVIGYILIALEHPIQINKTATSLLLACALWVCLVIGGSIVLHDQTALKSFLIDHPGSTYLDWLVHVELVNALGETSEIIFFLLGAMTIVELIDTMGGFKILTDRIATTNKVKLMWIISLLAFCMSSILDNMTTAIVMCALLHKLVGHKKKRWVFTAMVILAANAGGAWSPIGDVTTIMLWVSEKISAANIIRITILPSLVSILIPLIIMSFFLKGEVERPDSNRTHLEANYSIPQWESRIFLYLGIGLLICVPIFKTFTHLPPYIGMLGALGILWITSEILHRKKEEEVKNAYSIASILARVDVSSILFFLGILMSVSALGTAGHLTALSHSLDEFPIQEPGKYYSINIIIGILSSVIDNVPLVAAVMGMYGFPMDHYFWEMLAYCAGTGGSLLIIGSAAGVAVMGMEKMDFIWYLKKISWIALIGYLAGAGFFILEKKILGLENMLNSKEESVRVEMNQVSIQHYLKENTFYIVEPHKEDARVCDSSTVRFFTLDTDTPIPFYGTNISTFCTRGKQLEIYNNNIDMIRGNVRIDNIVGDTMAHVQFGNRDLVVTQSGRVHFLTPNGGLFLLQRIK